MITVKPSTNNNEIKKYLSLSDDGLIYFEARDGGGLLGGGAADARGEIIAVKADFPMLHDGIIKAFINFFDRRDIKELYSVNTLIFSDLKKAKFKEEDGKCTLNTDEYFGKPCEHDK